jgi:hypothetical protein
LYDHLPIDEFNYFNWPINNFFYFNIFDDFDRSVNEFINFKDLDDLKRDLFFNNDLLDSGWNFNDLLHFLYLCFINNFFYNSLIAGNFFNDNFFNWNFNDLIDKPNDFLFYDLLSIDVFDDFDWPIHNFFDFNLDELLSINKLFRDFFDCFDNRNFDPFFNILNFDNFDGFFYDFFDLFIDNLFDRFLNDLLYDLDLLFDDGNRLVYIHDLFYGDWLFNNLFNILDLNHRFFDNFLHNFFHDFCLEIDLLSEV